MTHPGDTPNGPGANGPSAMVIDEQHFDVLIIGSGAGGGTMAGALAAAGRKVLLLEQGSVLPPTASTIWGAKGSPSVPIHSSAG